MYNYMSGRDESVVTPFYLILLGSNSGEGVGDNCAKIFRPPPLEICCVVYLGSAAVPDEGTLDYYVPG